MIIFIQIYTFQEGIVLLPVMRSLNNASSRTPPALKCPWTTTPFPIIIVPPYLPLNAGTVQLVTANWTKRQSKSSDSLDGALAPGLYLPGTLNVYRIFHTLHHITFGEEWIGLAVSGGLAVMG